MSTSPALVSEPTSLYEDDFYGWIGRQIALVKAGRKDEVDLENIAEVLDDLGKSIYRELETGSPLLCSTSSIGNISRRAGPEVGRRRSGNTGSASPSF